MRIAGDEVTGHFEVERECGQMMSYKIMQFTGDAHALGNPA